MLLALALALPTFIVWATVHELAHLVAAIYVRRGQRLTYWRIRPYPHRTPWGWVWASVDYEFDGLFHPTVGEAVTVFLAPRAPDLLAVLVLPFVPWPWAVLVGGGLVDLAVGSLGIGEHTDLRQAARMLDISPWWLRLPGWLAVLAGAGAWFLYNGMAGSLPG